MSDSDSSSVESVTPRRMGVAAANNDGDDMRSYDGSDESSVASMPPLEVIRIDREENGVNEENDVNNEDNDDDDMPYLSEVDENEEMPYLSEVDENEAAASDDDHASMPPLRQRNPFLDSEEDDDDSMSSSTPSSMPGLLPGDYDFSSEEDDSDDSIMPRLLRRGVSSSSCESFSSDESTAEPKEPSFVLNITTFPQIADLSDDLVVNIMSFVMNIPYEEEKKISSSSSRRRRRNRRRSSKPAGPSSTLTHVLPLVSKHFHELCDNSAGYFWKCGLVRLMEKEPLLWKEGLFQSFPSILSKEEHADKTNEQLLERAYHSLLSSDEQLKSSSCTPTSSYKQVFRSILDRYIRYDGPVFYMPGFARLERTFSVHFFEPRYRLLIQTVMEDFPEEARRGQDIEPSEDGKFPTFVYAHTSPLVAGSPACIVQVSQCLIHPDGSADVELVPKAYVRLANVWEVPETGSLHQATGIRMGREACRDMEARSSPPEMMEMLEMLAGGGDPNNMGMRGTIQAILEYLAHQGDRRDDDDEEDDDEDEEVVGLGGWVRRQRRRAERGERRILRLPEAVPVPEQGGFMFGGPALFGFGALGGGHHLFIGDDDDNSDDDDSDEDRQQLLGRAAAGSDTDSDDDEMPPLLDGAAVLSARAMNRNRNEQRGQEEDSDDDDDSDYEDMPPLRPHLYDSDDEDIPPLAPFGRRRNMPPPLVRGHEVSDSDDDLPPLRSGHEDSDDDDSDDEDMPPLRSGHEDSDSDDDMPPLARRHQAGDLDDDMSPVYVD